MKKIIALCGALLILSGCTETVYVDEEGNVLASQTHESKFGKQFDVVNKYSDNGMFYELRNRETGVHYYYVINGYNGGLAPVYEKDGSIRVSPKTN